MENQRHRAKGAEESKHKQRSAAAKMISLERNEHHAGSHSGKPCSDHQANGGCGEAFAGKIDAENDAQQPDIERAPPGGEVNQNEVTKRCAFHRSRRNYSKLHALSK